MFKTFLKNKKAQNTAEYALLIALVVAGVIAMQTYAQRALQGRVRDASSFLTQQTSELGNTSQYEPYYLSSNYTTERADNEASVMVAGQQLGGIRQEETSNRSRRVGGEQVSTYDTSVVNGGL